MALTAGTSIGAYEIVAAIGAGGMGEVYRARDTKLHRHVALKILPDAFAADADRLARLTREAQTLAVLNHPHIAQIHGLEDRPASSGQTHLRALVMEFVEGDNLADRIARGPIPIDDVLPLGMQIAEALAAAHEVGIVHRDLKPANIKVTPDGTVKVLDFGLAKAVDAAASSSQLPSGQTLSPTFTSPVRLGQGIGGPGTEVGTILGTAAYMSPEQARGKPVNKRADIWAFGCVVFEMLTARALFAGETVSDTIAAVLRHEIDWTLLPADTPAEVRRLLRRCLERDPRNRLQDAGDARLMLAEAIRGESDRQVLVPVASRMPRVVLLAMLGIAGVSLVAGALLDRSLLRAPEIAQRPQPIVRFTIDPPAGVTRIVNVALAPDSSFIVYLAQTATQSALYVRGVADGESRRIAGTEGAQWPFISVDGRWVGFFRAGKLHKVALAGGDVLTLCDAAGGPGAAWLPDGRITFAASWLTGLFVVSADGGPVTQLSKVDTAQGERGHWWPSMLPDGRVLFTVFMAGSGLNDNRVAVLDATTGKYEVLFPGARASWLPSGHILYFRAGRYQIVPVDPHSLRPKGESVPVLEDATELDPAGDWPQPVVSAPNGSLAYVPGRHIAAARLAWLTPRGPEPLALPVRAYFQVAISPDDRHAAVASFEAGRYVIRVVDLERGTDEPLAANGANWDPLWLDNDRLAYTSMRKGDFDVYAKNPASAAADQPLLDDGADTSPEALARDGRLVIQASQPDGTYVLKLFDPRTPTDIATLTGQAEGGTAISPDQKWIAYTVTRDGGYRVYVQPFPGSTGAMPLSRFTDSDPVFRQNAQELYVRRGRDIVAMTWREDNGRFVAASERVVAQALDPGLFDTFSVTADGRVLAIVPASEETPPRVNVVLGWASELPR